MRLYLLVLALFFFSGIAYTMPADSCLKMICPNGNGAVNPDSVRVDSCIHSSTFGKSFAKRYYEIGFPYNFYPFDQIIQYREEKTVSDISSNYADFKTQFQQLEQEVGKIFFTRIHPRHSDVSDNEIVSGTPTVIVYFEEYQNIEAILGRMLTSIDSVLHSYCHDEHLWPISVDEKENNIFSNMIYPNPVNDLLYIRRSDLFSSQLHKTIVIYSVQGEKIYDSEFTESIDVSKFPQGLYFIKIGSNVSNFIKI